MKHASFGKRRAALIIGVALTLLPGLSAASTMTEWEVSISDLKGAYATCADPKMDSGRKEISCIGYVPPVPSTWEKTSQIIGTMNLVYGAIFIFAYARAKRRAEPDEDVFRPHDGQLYLALAVISWLLMGGAYISAWWHGMGS